MERKGNFASCRPCSLTKHFGCCVPNHLEDVAIKLNTTVKCLLALELSFFHVILIPYANSIELPSCYTARTIHAVLIEKPSGKYSAIIDVFTYIACNGNLSTHLVLRSS